MKVLLAKNAGFCYGVKRAVNTVLDMCESGEKIYCLGQLIHNDSVTDKLKEKGVSIANSIDEISDKNALVVIRTHGEPPCVYDELKRLGLKILDLTCPSVKLIHERVNKEKEKHEIIVIVGKHTHPEVIATHGWAGENSYVVETAEDVENIPQANSAFVVAQTTLRTDAFENIVKLIKQKIPHTNVFNSICSATEKRQAETEELAKISDTVFIVGGKNSSNTQKLYEIANKNCKNVKYISDIAEVALEKCCRNDIISVIAGASTPDWLIREVYTLMSELEKVQAIEEVEPVQVAEEEIAAVETVEETVAEEAAIDENAVFLSEVEKTFKSIKRGQFVKGVVVQVSDDEVCINIGYKSDGIIKKEDLTADGTASPAALFNIGDEIEAEVISLNDGEGNVRLSRKKIESQLKWKAFVDELDKDKVYECKVLKVIKGGVLSKLEGYDAFIPASQLSLKYVEDLGTFVGQTLQVKVIDVDKRQKRFVLSHKDVLVLQEEDRKKALFESFEKGSVVKGVVKRLADFGAFVDVGGVDGLLHITDISWVRIKHPSDVLSENQEVEVKVLNVDPEKKKISLGLKQLLPKPWDLAADKYIVGADVEGKVVRIAPFGAFVQLEPTIDGLIHISQVADRRIEKVEDVLNIGDIVTARVLEVNPEKKRISLSIRAILNEQRAAEQAEKEEIIDEEEVEFEQFEIPPVQETTTSLADFFPKMDD